MTFKAVRRFMDIAKKNRVSYHNFLLTRKVSYNPEGRYQAVHEVLELDRKLKEFLNNNLIYHKVINPLNKSVVKNILTACDVSIK